MGRQEDFFNEATKQIRDSYVFLHDESYSDDDVRDIATSLAEYAYRYAVEKACEYIGNYLGMALSCYPIDIDILVKDKFVSKFVDCIRKTMDV